MGHRVLIVYGTTEGQTEKIAFAIAARLRAAGDTVETLRAERAAGNLDLGLYDGVLVGGSVHAGRHQRAVVAFAREHRASLGRSHGGFFSVSLSQAHHTEEGRQGAMECADRFVSDTGWSPERMALFAGALRYSRYGFFKRWMLKRIAARAGGPTDTSHDYELTDWTSVARFADAFHAALDRTAPAAE